MQIGQMVEGEEWLLIPDVILSFHSAEQIKPNSVKCTFAKRKVLQWAEEEI